MISYLRNLATKPQHWQHSARETSPIIFNRNRNGVAVGTRQPAVSVKEQEDRAYVAAAAATCMHAFDRRRNQGLDDVKGDDGQA